MANNHGRTAVGAGTAAGDAEAEGQAPESRAAEAETDAQLESLHVTGAGPTRDRPARRGPSGIRPEQPRHDLENNEAGVASRLDRTEPER